MYVLIKEKQKQWKFKEITNQKHPIMQFQEKLPMSSKTIPNDRVTNMVRVMRTTPGVGKA